MERKVDENEETTSEEEEEVPGTSACSQRNENGGIADSTACSCRNENQGVILHNDDSGIDKSFLSSRSHIHDYAKRPSCSSLVASDADSSVGTNIGEPHGIGMLSSTRNPFLCDSTMSNSYNDTLSTMESPDRDPGSLSSDLFEPGSFQLLPEAQLNLSLDKNNPPNYADCSNPGASTSSDPPSQLLRQTQASNSLVVSNDRVRRHRPTSSISSAVRSPCAIPDCRRFYNTSHTFGKHIRWDERRRVYVCMWCECGRSSQSLVELYNHLCTHSVKNSFTCKMRGCNRSFTNSSEFSRHVNLHSGECPYICGNCGAAFERSEDLDAHKITHDSDSD